MVALVFICLLGVFSNHSLTIYRNFRGSSIKLRTMFQTCGNIGQTAFYILLAVSIWRFTWYWAAIVFALYLIWSSMTSVFFQKKLMGMRWTPYLMIAFLILSIYKIIVL